VQFESISLDFQFQRTVVISMRKYSKAHTLYVDYVVAHTLYVDYVVAHTLYVDHVLAHTLCSGSHLICSRSQCNM
jgi:hypothetical protein